MRTKDGLRTLFDAEHMSVRKYFRRMTGSASVAEDLTQETFLRLAAADVATLHSPAAYLRRISLNLIADMKRANRRSRLSSATVEEILDVPDPTGDPEAHLIAKDRMERMQAALDELPPRRRAILLAARLEGVPHRVLAQTHGVSIRTIEIEIRKALEYCARSLLD